jgi:hypothetical protein
MSFRTALTSTRHATSTRSTGSRSSHWSKGCFALALLAMCAAAGSAAVEAAPGQNRGSRRAHVDRELTARLDSADFTREERVIVTFKKGAKSHKLQQLRALGAQVDKDFGAIEAVAARIPRGLLRELAEQDDVVALSVDADVSPMSVAGVSGTAQGSAYSLRSTLGLEATTLAPLSRPEPRPARRAPRSPVCPGRTRSPLTPIASWS